LFELGAHGECAGAWRSIMIVERTEYKDKPVLVLKRNEDDKYPFSFGLSKARLIIEAIEDIKKFVAENDSEEKK